MCSDSLSSLLALLNIRSCEKLVVEIQHIINTINDLDIKVDFTHVRGHTGIHGNERADILAKDATRLSFTLNISEPYAYWKNFFTKEIVKEWNSEYLASNKGGWTKRFLPTITFRAKLHHLKTDFFVTQFLTGHGHYKDYLSKLNISSCNLCDCGQDRENPEHLLFKCKNLNSQREILILELKRLSCSWPPVPSDLVKSIETFYVFKKIIHCIMS